MKDKLFEIFRKSALSLKKERLSIVGGGDPCDENGNFGHTITTCSSGKTWETVGWCYKGEMYTESCADTETA